MPMKEKKITGVKQVYRVKKNLDGSIQNLKEKLIVKEYYQIGELIILANFALVARLDTIRLLIRLVAPRQWEILHLDVKSAFSKWLS